jgi:hypothetical protein
VNDDFVLWLPEDERDLLGRLIALAARSMWMLTIALRLPLGCCEGVAAGAGTGVAEDFSFDMAVCSLASSLQSAADGLC